MTITDERLEEWKALADTLRNGDPDNKKLWRLCWKGAEAINYSIAEVERLRKALRTAANELDLAAQKTINLHALLSRGLYAAADRARTALQEPSTSEEA